MINSLRFRLTLIFVGLAIGPLVVVSVITGQRSFDSLVQQSVALQREVVANVEGEIEAVVEERKNELVLLNQVLGLEAYEVGRQRAILSNLLLYQQTYQEVVLLDAAGQERIRLSRSGVVLKGDLESRAESEEFLFPAGRGKVYYGPVRFNGVVREPLITIAIPMVDLRGGEVVSVLMAELRLKVVWDLLASIELPNGGNVYVVDRTGQVIAHRNPTVVLQGTTIDLPEKDGRAKGLSGTDVIIARDVLQLGDQELMVIAEQPASSALELAMDNVRISVVATSVFLLVAVVLVVFSARYIVRPIQALAASARAISSGDFTRRVQVSTRDEVYELATAFNSMSGQLALSLTSLEQEIAERKKTEEELERYRDQLEELVRVRTQQLEEAQDELLHQERLSALGQLTATVAHEIRNPLGTVRTAVFAIGDAIERQQMGRIERARQLAERNIIRCDNIIRELLDYSRDWTLRLQPTPIDAWLEELLDEQAFPEDITCIRELEAGIEIPIDQEHLRRAVVNVLENAVDAVQDPGATGNRLVVGTRVIGQAAVRLEIWISDTGPGIPSDVLDRVFEPLFSTKTFGVGLGMSIVKSILEQHGGGVEVQSEMGRGTTVVLWLPTLA